MKVAENVGIFLVLRRKTGRKTGVKNAAKCTKGQEEL